MINFDKANQLFESASNLSPADPRVINVLGRFWLMKKEYKKANMCFDEEISINHESALSYSDKGEFYQLQKEYKYAETFYKKSIEFGYACDTGYTKLFKLYGRNAESFTKYQDLIFNLLEKVIADLVLLDIDLQEHIRSQLCLLQIFLQL